jgi:hypothetical protein
VGDPNFRFFAQDLDEGGMDNVRARPDVAAFLPAGVFDGIRRNPELQLRYADRAHRHLTGDGALSPQVASQRWQDRYQEIYSAVIDESARWGDTHWRTVYPRHPYRRDVELAREGRYLAETFFPERSQVLIDQLRSLRIYPQVDAPAWNHYGGPVPADFRLTMSAPDGQGALLYTLDGTDPRQFGGDVSPGALLYDGAPIQISRDTVVKARVLAGGQWSALGEGEFVVVGPDSPYHLRVTEINCDPHPANPVAGMDEANVEASEFEYVELANTGSHRINLGGVQLARGATFTFPADATLGPGQYVLVVKNRDAFLSRYGAGANIAGQFESGTLPDTFGLIQLRDAAGRPIQSIAYSTQEPWSQRAHGQGSSLEVVDPLGDGSQLSNWQSSHQFGGSPGGAESSVDPPATINEVLAHPVTPAVDLIELHNMTADLLAIGNWYISNSQQGYFQHRIGPDTTIPGNGYHVLTQTEFGFDLDPWRGDQLWLIAADAEGRPLRFVDLVQFGPSGAGVSLGPGPEADGRWFPLAEPTFGSENSGPRPGNVIISEVHYAPVDPDGDRRQLAADDFEYIELYNRSDTAEDLSHWRLTGGVEWVFPSPTTIDAHQALLVVPFDPADDKVLSMFRFLYGVGPAVPLLGPYTGGLEDGGDVVGLERPDTPPAEQPSLTPFLFVDEVAYRAEAPWPDATAGQGSSITRVSAESFGRIPASWTARAFSPGSVDFAVQLLGDVNEDGRLDAADLTRLIEAGKYLTGEPASAREGDFNGDGLFDPLDLVAVLRTGRHW